MRFPPVVPVLLLLVPLARAQGVPALVTDRPDQTESAVTVTPGWGQVEGGVAYMGHETLSPSVLARIGLVRGLEVRLGLAAERAASVVDEVSPGGKVRLWDESGGRPEAALLAGIAVPVAGDPAGAEVRLSLASTLSERLSLGYNLGAVWDDLRSAPEVLYTLTLGISAADRVGAFAEAFGTGARPSVATGLTYLAAPNLQFDVAGGHALRDAGYFVGVGASYRLPR